MGPPRRGLACWDPSPRRSSHPRTASGTDLGAGLLGFIKKVRRDGLRSPSRGHGSCLVTAEDDLYSSMSLLQRLPKRVTRAARRGVRPVAPCRDPLPTQICRLVFYSRAWAEPPGTISAGPRPKDGRRAAGARDYLPLMALAGEGL
jgi:hypothetical protein